MKKVLFISSILVLSCQKPAQVHPPLSGVVSDKDLEISKKRTKMLNLTERQQIQEWIDAQSEKYYPTNLNYWTSVEGFDAREKRKNETEISYEYELYDFDKTKIYDAPIGKKGVKMGHFHDLKVIDDALKYTKSGEEVTLLAPSSLGYGTFGDQKKIDNDIPLIIKLKVY